MHFQHRAHLLELVRALVQLRRRVQLALVLRFVEQVAYNPEQLAQVRRALEFDLLLGVLAIVLEELEQSRVRHDHLELLLWRAVAVPHDGDDGTQFLVVRPGRLVMGAPRGVGRARGTGRASGAVRLDRRRG